MSQLNIPTGKSTKWWRGEVRGYGGSKQYEAGNIIELVLKDIFE